MRRWFYSELDNYKHFSKAVKWTIFVDQLKKTAIVSVSTFALAES